MHTSDNIQQQICELIAFIILFEKKIQQIRIKLAGNEDFHTKLAFNLLDDSKKNQISAQDILEVVNRYSLSSSISLVQAQLLIKKYSSSTSPFLTSHQFLIFISPFTNQSLQNRLLLRNLPKSLTQLSISLSRLLIQLISTSIMMLTITESIKQTIQQANLVSFLQMVHFVKGVCANKQKLFYFVNSKDKQYDFQLQDVRFFVHYFSRCKENDVDQLTDQHIKQLIMPIDLKSHKTQILSHKTINTFQQKQRNNVFSNTKAHYFLPSRTVALLQKNQKTKTSKSSSNINFLSTNYKQTSKNFYKPLYNPTFTSQREFDRLDSLDQNVQTHQPTAMIYNRNSKIPNDFNRDVRNTSDDIGWNNHLYSANNRSSIKDHNVSNDVFMIQKFTKQSNNIDNNSRISQVQINKFFKENPTSFLNNSRNQNVQKFQDDYINNRSQYSDQMSRGSAFLQY